MNDLGVSFSFERLWQVGGGQLILLGLGLLLILADLWMEKDDDGKRISRLGWYTAIGFAAALGHVVYREWNLTDVVFMGVFSIEKFSAFLVATVLLSGILAALMSIGYMKNNRLARGEFFILLVFAVYGAVAFIQSVDLLMMFIALEVMSIAVYVLAAFLKGDRRSQEGAMKYFLLGSFGSAFFLFGLALLFGLTGTVNLSQLAKAISDGLYQEPATLIAFGMIMAGLFFKMAFVPFHMWTPDVYEGSPSVVTGFMATAVKAAAFGVFIKVLTVTFSPILALSGQPEFYLTGRLAALAPLWKPVIWWLAILTMFIGNLVAASQQNIKRMLAYSSIAHAGYMAVGIIAANEAGRAGVLFYLFAYTLMNMGAFGVLYVLDGEERGAQTLEDYRGLGYRYPTLSFLMALFLVSMAGLPPTAGFIAKFYVFSAAIQEGYFVLAALGILTSVIGAYYYLRVIYMLYMKEPAREVQAGALGLPTVAVLVFTALAVLYLGVLPNGLSQLAYAAQKSLAMVF